MSSAILYLAIIAIWAGVLIPRWLRRDTSRAASALGAAEAEPAAEADSVMPDEADEDDEGDEDARQGTRRRGSDPAPVPREETRRRVLAAPVPADYEDLGRARDFTPGLRQPSARDAPDDDAYDQYTENRLRAVGD